MALRRLPMFLECCFYGCWKGKGEERVGEATTLWNPHHHLAGKKKVTTSHTLSPPLAAPVRLYFDRQRSQLYQRHPRAPCHASSAAAGTISVVWHRACSPTRNSAPITSSPSPLPPVAYQTLRYPPYTKAELNEISKAQTARDGVVYSDMAIELCGRKVAKASGDVRAAMDKLESLRMADARSRAATALATGAGGDAAPATTEGGGGGGGERAGPIVIGSDLRQVSRVLSRSVNSKTAQIRAIAALPVHQQYVLVAAVREVGDEGRTITRGQSGQKGAFELSCGNGSFFVFLGAWGGERERSFLQRRWRFCDRYPTQGYPPAVCLSSSRACK